MPYSHLTDQERVQITQLQSQDLSQAQIARQLRRSPSTVSRELRRNADDQGAYHHGYAQQISSHRRSAAGQRCWADHAPRRAAVRAGFKQKHSPEIIAGRLKRMYPKDPMMWVSHESIYRWSYREHAEGRGHGLQTRRRRTRRRCRSVGERPGERGQIPGPADISKRPSVVEGRIRFGDWEGDTVEGAKGTGFLVTLVERKSRLVLIAKVADKRASTVGAAMVSLMEGLPSMLKRTMTLDNGKEFADFAATDAALSTRTFFARPHAPWERGANENTNGLIRDWLPKGSSFSKVSKSTVDRIQRMLNNRPRKCLDYRTPLEVLNRLPGVALRS